MSLLGPVPLKVSGMWALVPLELVLDLIRIKSVNKLAEYFGQLFISIIALIRFGS